VDVKIKVCNRVAYDIDLVKFTTLTSEYHQEIRT
jgi:hypothetical protein